MAPRKTFVLVYSSDIPVSADVVREDNVTLREPDDTVDKLDIGAQVKFKWQKNKKEWSVDEGVVLKKNTQVSLRLLKVKSDGTLLPEGSTEEGIGTKKQELEKQRYQQNHVMDNHLQGLAEEISINGLESVANRMPILPSTLRLPKQHSPDHLQALEEKLRTLQCYRRGPGKVELWKDGGVWVDYGALTTTKLRFCRPNKRKPKALFSGILRLLVPEDILRVRGLSSTGTRGCVQFPRKLVDLTIAYVTSANRQAGGLPDEVNFDPIEEVRSLLSNEVNNNKSKKKKRSSPSSTTTSQLSVSTSLTASSSSESQIAPSSSNSPLSSSLFSPNSSPTPSSHSLSPPPNFNMNRLSPVQRTPSTSFPTQSIPIDSSVQIQTITQDHTYTSPSGKTFTEISIPQTTRCITKVLTFNEI